MYGFNYHDQALEGTFPNTWLADKLQIDCSDQVLSTGVVVAALL